MIKNFLHKQLERFHKSGKSKDGGFIAANKRKKVLTKLDAMEMAEKLDDLRIPSNRLHKTAGKWNITIARGYPFRIFFDWEGGNITNVDWSDPH